MTEHMPAKPGYDCDQGCGRWPCHTARTDFTVMARLWPGTSRLILDMLRADAAASGVDGNLEARFLGWLPAPAGSLA